MLPSRPSGESPDPGDSGDFGVTDLFGDLGGSRDREAVSRMVFPERELPERIWIGEHPRHGRTAVTNPHFPENAQGSEWVVAEYVRADTTRGAVSPELDERDDETERRLLDRMEHAGLLKDGMTATDAREALDA